MFSLMLRIRWYTGLSYRWGYYHLLDGSHAVVLELGYNRIIIQWG